MKFHELDIDDELLPGQGGAKAPRSVSERHEAVKFRGKSLPWRKDTTPTAGGVRRFLLRTRCQLVKLAKKLEHEELRLLRRSRVTVLREVAVSRDPETGDFS